MISINPLDWILGEMNQYRAGIVETKIPMVANIGRSDIPKMMAVVLNRFLGVCVNCDPSNTYQN